MENRHYDTLLKQGETAPCNGCEHEDYCRLGYTCEMYRAWENMPSRYEFRKKTLAELDSFSRIPDRKI